MSVLALALSGCGDDNATSIEQKERPTPSRVAGHESKGTKDNPNREDVAASNQDPPGEPAKPVQTIPLPPVEKGGDDSIQTFGEEAGSNERAAAAAILDGYLNAQAKQDWAGMCSYLMLSIQEALANLQSGVDGDESCESALQALQAGAPKEQLKRLTQFEVGSVRVDGDEGFVIFKVDTWYAAYVTKEDGAWKLGSVSPAPLN